MNQARAQSPVFLFCSGMRSGSTLLQRIIIASGETMVWGETGGALNHFHAAWQDYIQMLSPGGERFPNGLGGNGNSQRESFAEADPGTRPHLWIPCINPDQAKLQQAFKSFFECFYAETATRLGYPRWGFKKVRSELAVARFMKDLYPAAKFVFLVREPLACLNSIKQHEWMDRPGDANALSFYIDQWRRTAGSFAAADFGYTIRYEELVGDAETRRKMFEYLEIRGVSAEFFDRSRPKGRSDSTRSLNFIERTKVQSDTKKERKALGYA